MARTFQENFVQGSNTSQNPINDVAIQESNRNWNAFPPRTLHQLINYHHKNQEPIKENMGEDERIQWQKSERMRNTGVVSIKTPFYATRYQ
jgi:hypothetical protein